MNHWQALVVVASKELSELARDRRTLALGMLLPAVLQGALTIGLTGAFEARQRTQLEAPLSVPVVGAEHAPNLVRFLESQNIRPAPAPADADAEVRSQNADTVLRIGPDFAEHWRRSESAPVELVYDSSRLDSRVPVGRLRGALAQYSSTLGSLRLVERGLSPEVLEALAITQRDVATPEAKRSSLLMGLPLLLILSAFIGVAAAVIDVTAGERERQSLEPLLATPVSRAALMSGKIGAASIFGVMSLILTLLSLRLATLVVPGTVQTLEISALKLMSLLVVLFPLVLLGSTLMTLLSATAKSVKEAQSYLAPLMLLPMVPTYIVLVSPLKEQLWQFAVPFLGQNQLILKVLRGDTVAPGQWALYLSSALLLVTLLWALAARLYQREQLAISS